MSKECLDSHRTCIVVSFWITVTHRSYFEFTKNYFIILCVRVNDQKHCTAYNVLLHILNMDVLTARTTFPNTQLKSCNFLFNSFTSTRISIHDLDGYMVCWYKSLCVQQLHSKIKLLLLIIIQNWFYLLIHTKNRHLLFFILKMLMIRNKLNT